MLARTPPFALTAPQLYRNEHELQIACTRMFIPLMLPAVTWSAVDHGHSFDRTIGRNGRPIGLLEAQKRKARGIKAGLPDYLLWHLGDAFAIELKMPDGELSDDQKDMIRSLLANRVRVKVCYSTSLVLATLAEWELLRPMRVAA
jgi:hypothetical protein